MQISNRKTGGLPVPYKVCPYCREVSYSAAENPKSSWLCPHCNRDIRDVESRVSLGVNERVFKKSDKLA